MTGRLSGVVAHDGPTKSCVSAAVLATVRSDQFAEWLTDWFNRACFRWHRSGYRVGLFDVIRDRPLSTAAEIAGCMNATFGSRVARSYGFGRPRQRSES
jgi:hypothetical protein